MQFSAILASLTTLVTVVSAQNVVSLVAPPLFTTVTAGVPFIITLQATRMFSQRRISMNLN